MGKAVCIFISGSIFHYLLLLDVGWGCWRLSAAYDAEILATVPTKKRGALLKNNTKKKTRVREGRGNLKNDSKG